MARSRPEDIEYINRLKFGSQFNYTPEHHGKEDIESDNYFHNISTRYLAAGDEIRVNIKNNDGSCCPVHCLTWPIAWALGFVLCG